MSGKPFVQLVVAFGRCQLEVSDGTQTVALGLLKAGIPEMIKKLQEAYNLMPDDESVPMSPAAERLCKGCNQPAGHCDCDVDYRLYQESEDETV